MKQEERYIKCFDFLGDQNNELIYSQVLPLSSYFLDVN